MFDLIPFGRTPFRPTSIQQMMDRMFQDDLAPFGMFGTSFRVDIRETDSAYIVESDLPGITKENINIAYENKYLTVSAKRDENTKDEQDGYIRQERRVGTFQRQFYVDNVDESNIAAQFADGVLTITLPKKPAGAQGKKQISIN